jgi:hypothetical protein
MKLYGPSSLDIRRQNALYASGEYDALSEDFIGILRHYDSRPYFSGATFAMTLFPFLEHFLACFTQADYSIPDRFHATFIQYNTLLSNLTAMSPLRTTDTFLEKLRDIPGSTVKILTLYSARNTAQFDRGQLFADAPQLASLWYHQYCKLHQSALLRTDITARLTAHLAHHDPRMRAVSGMNSTYYGSTYIDGTHDRDAKRFLNQTAQHQIGFSIHNTPDPKKIAVISDLWYPTHAVYRNYAAYVRELKHHYHLTLFHTVTAQQNLDTGMFDTVCRLDMSNRDILIAQLSGGFHLAYFPDVGMTDASIVLSNCRIAPVQVCSPGHSVSTWGSQIDYFISGADVELPDTPERNYSERLVLLPGMGVIHNPPQYAPRGVTKSTDEIIVNCPWSGHKMCARFLAVIRNILERAARPVRLHIFPNDGVTHHNGYLPFLADLRAALGERATAEVFPCLPYAAYMQQMETGDLTLDCFHFAGCNSVADSLFLRIPTVVWEGDKWYNRIGPAMLRLAGMEDCICASAEDYTAKALQLISDDAARAGLRQRLRTVDLEATIFSARHATAFRNAIGYLAANHSRLQREGSRAPISIG